MAGPAAETTSDRFTVAPSSTRPVLMKNSVRKAAASRDRRPVTDSTAFPRSPSVIAYTGYSTDFAMPPRGVPASHSGTLCSRKRADQARPRRTTKPATR
jgi:hypothetical protein